VCVFFYVWTFPVGLCGCKLIDRIQGFKLRQLSMRDFFQSESDEGQGSNLLPEFDFANS
jgi:hypothetical protein